MKLTIRNVLKHKIITLKPLDQQAKPSEYAVDQGYIKLSPMPKRGEGYIMGKENPHKRYESIDYTNMLPVECHWQAIPNLWQIVMSMLVVNIAEHQFVNQHEMVIHDELGRFSIVLTIVAKYEADISYPSVEFTIRGYDNEGVQWYHKNSSNSTVFKPEVIPVIDTVIAFASGVSQQMEEYLLDAVNTILDRY